MVEVQLEAHSIQNEISDRSLIPTNLYDLDFYAWTQTQSELLRLGNWQELDIENLVEEITSLGKQQKQELLKLHIQENPSLKSYLDQAVIEAYELALALVVRETPLDYQDLPMECSYEIAQILDPQFPINMN